MKVKTKNHTTIRLNNKSMPETEARAKELSIHFGRSISDLIRWLINEKWKEVKK